MGDFVKIIGVLAAVKYFILDTVTINSVISSETNVTAIVAACVVFVTVTISLIIRRNG